MTPVPNIPRCTTACLHYCLFWDCLLCHRDQTPSAFTAVRTTGLNGETGSSPTSPRVKPPSSGFGGNSNSPLLKAALNANLTRINAAQQQQQQVMSASGAKSHAPGSLSGSLSATGIMSASGALGGGGYGSGQPGISSNVKQRLKEYFVAHNTELLPTGGAAAAGVGAGAGGSNFASSDTGYSHSHGQPAPMQH